ncbi:MAG: hypothetical protein U0P45_07525 [Acidimicrobiales bacterium]
MDNPKAPQDDAVQGVLAQLVASGASASFEPGRPHATLRCSACGSESDAERFEVEEERRLEGASDPDDMVLVVAARCPVCGSKGAIVLGYGAAASAVDSDLVLALARPA